MSQIATVYATFADADEAARIARILVEEKLAACANILGECRSIYRWQGAIEEGIEVAVLFKTSMDRTGDLMTRLETLHSYDTPAALVWPIEAALPAYEAWVKAETAN